MIYQIRNIKRYISILNYTRHTHTYTHTYIHDSVPRNYTTTGCKVMYIYTV